MRKVTINAGAEMRAWYNIDPHTQRLAVSAWQK